MRDVQITQFVMMAVAIGVVVLVVVLKRVADRRRREAYQALASQHGWNYAEQDPAFVNRWDGDPFGSGYGRRACNVVTGVHRGQQFAAFEHRHKTRSGGRNNSSSTHWHFVCALRLPVFLPRIEIKRRGFGSFIADWFGMQDIQIGHEEFDKSFRIKSDDEQFARDFLQPAVVDYVMSNHLYDVRIDGADLLDWESGRLDPTAVPLRVDRLIDFLERIAPATWTTYGRT